MKLIKTPMQLTKEQFKEYIREHGITEARTTEEFYSVPENTTLHFGIDDEDLSTFDDCIEGKNKKYGYDFAYEWYWFNDYNGEFIIEKRITVYNKQGKKLGKVFKSKIEK